MSVTLADLPPDDPRLELLDTYLTQLQAGLAPPREQLLAAHPELADLLDCLDRLEKLALPTDTDSNATVLDVTPAPTPTEKRTSVSPGTAYRVRPRSPERKGRTRPSSRS